jgi:hypothetical protein
MSAVRTVGTLVWFIGASCRIPEGWSNIKTVMPAIVKNDVLTCSAFATDDLNSLTCRTHSRVVVGCDLARTY